MPPKTSLRPRARPTTRSVTRPRARPDNLYADYQAAMAVEGGNREAAREARENPKRKSPKESPEKMAKGGMCRGMGAATRGGKYKAM